MNYGFVIDNRSCIGCHACSTACKQENEVPLGVYRTWVKYVEKGAFPHARRTFQVTRCNHCANPPCVRICPVTAMYQRHDGIVEFDPEVCIGCKACLQACPYDAIYIDPDSGTAAKCHYCSHRTDIGLEPACVVVCPTQAIISGDMDDPGSRISQLVARETVTVRKPEQGTAPKLFYIEGDAVALVPTAAETGGSFVWADVVGGKGAVGPAPALTPRPPLPKGTGEGEFSASGTEIRSPGAQGMGTWQGPIHIGEGTLAEHMVQTTYNAQHKVPWHWPVPAYLVTKAIGSGVFMLLALLFGLGIVPFDRTLALAGTFVSLVFIGITTALLVLDLERPERFLKILTRPQWASWLTRGAFILIGFTVVAGLWFLVEGGVGLGVVSESAARTVRPLFLWGGVVLAVLSAIYTAFLFGQAEGRDLWQSPLLPVHLLVQAGMAGGVTLAVLAMVVDPAPATDSVVVAAAGIAVFCLLADLFMMIVGEFGIPHASESAARAAHAIRHGRYRWHWKTAVWVGHVLPLAGLILYVLVGMHIGSALAWIAGETSPQFDLGFLLALMGIVLLTSAPITILIGLYLYEYAYVMAPQEVPNS